MTQQEQKMSEERYFGWLGIGGGLTMFIIMVYGSTSPFWYIPAVFGTGYLLTGVASLLMDRGNTDNPKEG